jgi:hypothetical protein
MGYYLHVSQEDRFKDSCTEDGSSFSFKRVKYHGPYSDEEEALDMAISLGYDKMCYTIEVVELSLGDSY